MSTFSDFGWQGSAQVHAFDYPSGGEYPCTTQAPELRDYEQELELARRDGIREGELRAKQEMDRVLARERAAITAALAEFRVQREEYFQKVEKEIVQLALSIARKILHREAQVDPMLLAGVVRVALGQIKAGTHVTLIVSPDEAAGWKRILGESSDQSVVPEVFGDPKIPRGECILRTEFGMTELGIEPQLKEIESGFLDLLAKREQIVP